MPTPPPAPFNMRPVEMLRQQAAEMAASFAQRPETRDIIVVSISANEMSASSYDNVEDADTFMTSQREVAHEHGETDINGRPIETTYVAYFEKGTGKLLLEWDRWRDKEEPAQWQRQHSQTGSGSRFILVLGAVGLAYYLSRHKKPPKPR
jgi:hypothetical protein